MKIICVCALVIVVPLIGGCDTLRISPSVSRIQPMQYSGPRIRVIVGQVANRTGSGTGEKLTIDPEVTREQLITELTQTGVFAVPRATKSGSSEVTNTLDAQYLIEGAVIEYNPSQTSIDKKEAWYPNPNVIDAITKRFRFKQDHVAMNIHLVDLRTNEIIDSATIEACPRDFSSRGHVSGQIKTPMQKAIRACLTKAAVWAANSAISETTQRNKEH